MAGNDLSVIVDATVAYENLARHVVMEQRRDLTKMQLDVLIGLRYAGKMTMTEVSRHLAVSKEQATRAVAPLVEKGYVTRKRNCEQYRLVEVSLTQEGSDFIDRDLAVVLEELERKLAGLSQEDLAKLLEASETALAVLRKNLGR